MENWDDLLVKICKTFDSSNLNSTVKFVFDTGRNVWVRSTATDAEVESDSSRTADLELRMKFDDAVKILNRELGPRKAIMQGRLKTKGDMALAWRVASLFSKPLS